MKKKKKTAMPGKPAAILAAVAAVVALTVVIVLLCTAGGPVDKVEKAAGKTLFAKNFTTMFTLTVNGETVDGLINAAADPDERKIEFYMQLGTRSADYICGIFNNTFVLADGNGENGQTVDLTDQIAASFDALDGNQVDWAALLDPWGNGLYEQLNGDFDLDVLLTCLKAWSQILNDKSWAQSNAGYSTSLENGVIMHSFSPDLSLLAEKSLPVFQPAFREAATYDALKDYLENAQFLLSSGKAELRFGVKGGKLVSADIDLRYHNTSVQGSLEFIGIGKTTVDIGAIAFAIDAANK